MPTRNINLTDHFDRFVAGQVDSGRFKNASEVMRAEPRLLESQEREESEKLTALRKLAAEGFDALDRGEAATIEESEQLGAFIARIGKRAARLAERRSGARCPSTVSAPMASSRSGAYFTTAWISNVSYQRNIESKDRRKPAKCHTRFPRSDTNKRRLPDQ